MKQFLLCALGLMNGWNLANAQNTKDTTAITILVIGLDSTRFSSNVFKIDDLAYYNDVPESEVIKHYSDAILEVFDRINTTNIHIEIPDNKVVQDIFRSEWFVERVNRKGETFLAIDMNQEAFKHILEFLKSKKSDYLLVLNYYEIFKKKVPEKISYDLKTKHFLDFELFNSELKSLRQERHSFTSSNIEAHLNQYYYARFAKDMMYWISADRQGNDKLSLEENYLNFREKTIKESFGFGASLGVDSPYGLFGILASRYLNNSMEFSGGIGYGFSGFNVGIGIRNHFTNFSDEIKRFPIKPFIGIHYSYATGNTFRLGGEKDEDGNQLDPDDVSEHEILSDHSIHFTSGLRYVFQNQAVLLNAGYAFAFGNHDALYLSGKQSSFREKFANLFAKGGLQISFTYIYYINN
ncbi:hypothetical protein QQ008_23820 [Fulvivirgaceae bacterium BMA10]|uniref:Outer membrane protein beta-barrel domain-containing protein n=1 Tax=Splendidivirga corallicola TaxID=3051826 RepID=A0ABT8KUH8_9BACT|nr:hypothetical protein [Fulvivirgaceae bacterium BMA10]